MNEITVNQHTMEPGCYIGGHYGQYGLASLVSLVDGFLGTSFTQEFPKVTDGSLAGSIGPGGVWDIGNEHTETCFDVAERAEAALNDATVGGYWTWEDGEFFLVSDDEEDED
jgi:hypothetical protein